MRMDQHIKRLIEKYTFEASRKSKKEALESYSLAYAQAKELGNPFTLRACAANLGALYVSIGTKEEAEKGLEYLHQAVPPNGTTDGVSNGDLYFNMALGCEVAGRPREAVDYLERAYKQYKGERDNVTMEIDSLKRLVQVNTTRRKYNDTVAWLKELEETYGRANRPKDQLLTMVQRITIQQQLQQTEEVQQALEQCCQMVEAFRKQQNTSEKKTAKRVMSEVAILVQVSVLLTQSKLEKAREYLEEALSLFEAEDSQTLDQAIVLQNLGTVCNYLYEWETSRVYHSKAAAIYQYFASLPPDPKSPIQPRSAQRCQGHCVANHAYAVVNMGDVDEARVLFDKARDLADRSGDVDTKWQMDEALGAIHFQLACNNLDRSQPLTADSRVPLRDWQLEHLDKCIGWYKRALTDMASAPKGTADVMDRVVEKLTLAKAFKASSLAAIAEMENPGASVLATGIGAARTAAASAVKEESDKEEEEDDDEDEDDEEDGVEEEVEEEEAEEEEEESVSEEEEGGGGKERHEVDGNNGEANGRKLPPKPSLQHLRLAKTMRPSSKAQRKVDDSEDDDDDQTGVKELYRAQLQEGTLEDTGGFHQEVKADVHAKPQHMFMTSSSGSSSASGSESDSDFSEGEVRPGKNNDDVESRRRPAPPIPTSSPPDTMRGTYETPGGGPRSGTRTLPSGDYAEIDFSTKKKGQVSADDREDPDYETVEVQQQGSEASSQSEKRVGFRQEESGKPNYLTHGSDKHKDSKTCSIM